MPQSRKAHKIRGPIYTVQLVHNDEDLIDTPPWPEQRIYSKEDVYDLVKDYFKGLDRQHLLAVLVDFDNKLIGVSTVSIGDFTSTLAHPREVFKVAILANAHAVFLVHNHPNGNPKPSEDDRELNFRLAQAGAILGIHVLNHVVIGAHGTYRSLIDENMHPAQHDLSLISRHDLALLM